MDVHSDPTASESTSKPVMTIVTTRNEFYPSSVLMHSVGLKRPKMANKTEVDSPGLAVRTQSVLSPISIQPHGDHSRYPLVS